MLPHPPPRSPLHALILSVVWTTIASGALVLSEPAPFDVLMLGLIVLLPVAGLALFTRPMLASLAVWLIVAGAGLGAALTSLDVARSGVHTLVTLYLSVAALILAAFVHRNPRAHVRLVMNAWLWAGVAAASLGIIGYFDLIPGAAEHFTGFGRARAAFKDANVFGPFLVPPLLWAVHLWLTRPPRHTQLPMVVTPLLAFAILLSFSRGAWLNAAIALGAFGYLSFVTAATDRQRVKLALAGLAGLAVLGFGAALALQVDSVAQLAEQRASLDQTYDHGPEGRFGGHAKAVRLILDNPLGIGAAEFGARHHHEDVHNVYFSMMLNHGWLGGLLYAGLMAATLLHGLRQSLRRSHLQGPLIVAWSCLLATAIEGCVIDTDHWRHFFVLTGLVWGLAEAVRVGAAAPSHVPLSATARLRSRTPCAAGIESDSQRPSRGVPLLSPGAAKDATSNARNNVGVVAIS